MKRFKARQTYLAFISILSVFLISGCGGEGHWDGVNGVGVATKAITAFSLAGVTGTINEPAKTIAVTLPFGTNVTAPVATFTHTGTGVRVGPVAQTSGTTPNNFTGPVSYTVTAADNTTATYVVTVTVTPALSSIKAITAFSFVGFPGSPGAINEATKTIAVTLPSGTAVTALTANFTTVAPSVKIGAVVQTSGAAPANDFTAPVTYRVTAADATFVDYVVTVTVTPALSSIKTITAFSFVGFDAFPGAINEAAKTIAVNLPFGTPVTALIANYTTVAPSVKIGAAVQTSGGVPANDFTAPVTYRVTAADATFVDYVVTVKTNVPNLGSAATFGIIASAAISGGAVGTTITGDIGIATKTLTSITDFVGGGPPATPGTVSGTIYASDAPTPGNTISSTARADVALAYQATKTAATLGFTTVSGNLVGMGNGVNTSTFLPGIYHSTSTLSISGASITLDPQGDANAVWIFDMESTLTTTTGGDIILVAPAQAKNVFWRVGVSATLGAAIFKGTILASDTISVTTQAVAVDGRLLASAVNDGAVTFSSHAHTVVVPAP